MPTYGTNSFIYGGEGDDFFETDYDQLAPNSIQSANIYGGSGNDRIQSLRSAIFMNAYGGDGDDKIFLGGSSLEIAVGGDGNDIIYGSEIDVDLSAVGQLFLYGDISGT